MGPVDRYRVSLAAALYRKIPSSREKKGLEESFPHQNWPIILGLLVFRNIAFQIITPSLYQFITTPKYEEENICRDNNSVFSPGLGSSETAYSWVLTIYFTFKLVSIPIAVVISERIPYIITILVTLSTYVVSGVLYGLANAVWVVIVSRSLMGCCSAFVEILVLGYIGEMGTHMDEIRERQGKRPKKYILFVAYSFAYNIAFMVAFGCNSIMVQFPKVEPYYWPGWFIAVLAVLCAATVVLTFREPRSFEQLKGYVTGEHCKGFKLSLSLQTGWKIQFICYLFLGLCAYFFAQIFSILVSLVTPVLSDQFGFSVEYTSHFLVAQSAAFVGGSVLLLIAKCFKLNNWLLLGVSLVPILIGVIIVGDWQAIGHDPCQQGWKNISSSHGDDLCLSTDTYLNSSLDFQEWCEAQTTSSHQCFWNPQSRITGECCNLCCNACLSKQKTMDFYQLSIGVLLMSVMVPIGFFSIPAILSDISSVESQSRVQIVFIGGFTISNILTPLWIVESYELSGNHTYIPMILTALFLIVLLLSLMVLYKILAPKSIRTEVSDLTHASINVSATLAILFGCTWFIN